MRSILRRRALHAVASILLGILATSVLSPSAPAPAAAYPGASAPAPAPGPAPADVRAAPHTVPATAVQDPDAVAFSHANHVPRVWAPGQTAMPEQARDCRGCHVFGAGGAVDAPQQLCAGCHQEQGIADLFPTAGWAGDMSEQRTSLSRSYRHDTHAALACRQCHAGAVQITLAGVVDVPDHLPIPTSSLSCEVCHGQDVTRADIESWEYLGGIDAPERLTPEFLKAEFGKINDGRIDPPADGPMRAFEHKDHVQPEYLSGAQAGLESKCSSCHTEVVTSGIAEAGLKTVSSDGCKKCHLGKGSQPLEAQTQTVERESPSVGTFAHSDHYDHRGGQRTEGVADEEAYTRLGEDASSTSCGACHHFDPAGRKGPVPRDFPFRPGDQHTYGGCRTCHTQGTLWQTAPGLHDSTPLADLPAGQGQIGWDRTPDQGARACAACHAFGTGTMATNREQDQVARFAPERFGFLGNAHPYITDPDADPSGDVSCAECHVAESLDDLRSRIVERPFRHDVHVSAGATDPAECLTCHTTARTAASTAALSEGLDGASYLRAALDPAAGPEAQQSCAQCHRSTRVFEFPPRTEPTASKERSAVRFAHADHGEVACSECHTLQGPEMLTLPAEDCTKCHDHEAGSGNGARTGRIEGNEIDSCVTCHGQDGTTAGNGNPTPRGVPARRADPAHNQDPRHRVSLELFARFDGNQYHPIPTDANYQTCSECHAIDAGADQVRQPSDNHILAKLRGSYHAGSANLNPASVNCYACHWRRPGDWVRYTDSTDQIRGAETAEVRGRFGAKLDNFPGPQAEGKVR